MNFSVEARFKSREFIHKLNCRYSFSRKNEAIGLLKKITGKNIALDYSQLRIGLLHYLNLCLPQECHIATTSYTIYDMINIIINSGKKPVFVDIDERTLGPNIAELITLVVKKKVRCVIYTYLHGYKESLDELAEICRKNDCILIEDCAQSLWHPDWVGSKHLPGSFGDAALFSTGLYKNINTVTGGFVLIDSCKRVNHKIISAHKSLNNHITYEFLNRFFYAIFFKFITHQIIFSFLVFPIIRLGSQYSLEIINKRTKEENNPKYIHRTHKDILRMNIMQKFLLNTKSEIKIKDDYEEKLKIAQCYLHYLKEIIKSEQIKIPGLGREIDIFQLKKISSFNQIPLICKNRKNLLKYLLENNSDVAEQHLKNLTSLKIYSMYIKGTSPIAENTSQNLLLLPCYPGLSLEYAKYISLLIVKYFKDN